MTFADFLENISGAEYIEYDATHGIVFEWNGSQTVNVWVRRYPGRMENVDAFMGDWASLADVKQAISEYAA